MEHDGTCDLVINRTYYPGWYASVNEDPERPVTRAEIGVQAVRSGGERTQPRDVPLPAVESANHLDDRPCGYRGDRHRVGCWNSSGLQPVSQGVLRAELCTRSQESGGTPVNDVRQPDLLDR